MRFAAQREVFLSHRCALCAPFIGQKQIFWSVTTQRNSQSTSRKLSVSMLDRFFTYPTAHKSRSAPCDAGLSFAVYGYGENVMLSILQYLARWLSHTLVSHSTPILKVRIPHSRSFAANPLHFVPERLRSHVLDPFTFVYSLCRPPLFACHLFLLFALFAQSSSWLNSTRTCSSPCSMASSLFTTPQSSATLQKSVTCRLRVLLVRRLHSLLPSWSSSYPPSCLVA